jgi:hypothetical protein
MLSMASNAMPGGCLPSNKRLTFASNPFPVLGSQNSFELALQPV